MRANSKAEAHAALISSAKVQGSNVYRPNGEKVGRIEYLMVDKASGRIAYAVLRAEGEHDLYPLPWVLLNYNERAGGYELNVTEAHLRDAPKFGSPDGWDWSDLKRGQRVHDYWRALPYWGF